MNGQSFHQDQIVGLGSHQNRWVLVWKGPSIDGSPRLALFQIFFCELNKGGFNRSTCGLHHGPFSALYVLELCV